MNIRKLLALALAAVLAVACSTNASPSPSVASSAVASAAASAAASATAAAPASAAPLAPDPAEAVIQNVEPNAQITFWTFYLSPAFDNYIKATIARFEATYPGVTVKWEDHQATFRQDLDNSYAAKSAPDVINLSVAEGWVSDYASKGLLLPLDDRVPQAVKDVYFPGLWKEQLVAGKNFQFPWYQSINVDLINKQIFDKAGLKPEDFPKEVAGLKDICQTLKDKASTVCDIRLTVSDLLAQMVYDAGVKVISDDGKKFTFDSPEAVAWLQRYADMVKAGTVDNSILTSTDDRVGLLLFSAGQAPFYQTGPNLIREVKSNNSQLYNNLAVVQAPIGKSGVASKGLMGISVKADTKFPNASIALAQYFTNARSMLEFSKLVAIYPSTPKSYDDPFFSGTPSAIEDSARPIAKSIVSTYQDIVPTVPSKGDVNEIVRKAIESALFGTNPVPAQKALSDAVAKANALIK